MSHLGINLTHYEDGRVKLTQPKLLAQILNEYASSTSLYPASPNTGNDNSDHNKHSILKIKVIGPTELHDQFEARHHDGRVARCYRKY